MMPENKQKIDASTKPMPKKEPKLSTLMFTFFDYWPQASAASLIDPQRCET